MQVTVCAMTATDIMRATRDSYFDWKRYGR